MKKYLIFLILLLTWASYAQAGSLMTVGGGVPSGAPAASGYYDPDGDSSDGSWYNTADDQTNNYTYIDDGTRSPTEPNIADWIKDANASSTYEGTLEEVTGSITTVRLYIYAERNANAGNTIYGSVSGNGSDWSSEQDFVVADAVAWLYKDFSVTWTNTTDFRFRLRASNTNSWLYVYAVYVEVNP